MKKLFTLFLISFLSATAFSQDYSAMSKYHFKNEADYKDSQPKVLEAANYLFSHPATSDKMNRLQATQYVMNWMEGTPEYTFSLGKKAMKLTKGNQDLLGLYLVALSKVAIENSGEKLSEDKMHTQAALVLAHYCANPDNGLEPSKKLMQLKQ